MKSTLANGVVGITGVTAGIKVSLADIEPWLRIASLLIGIVIGALSAYSILLSIQRKKRLLKENVATKQEELEPDTDL